MDLSIQFEVGSRCWYNAGYGMGRIAGGQWYCSRVVGTRVTWMMVRMKSSSTSPGDGAGLWRTI